MELHLSPELEGKLARAADRLGVSVEALACEALERAVDYDDRFRREVETAEAAAADRERIAGQPVPRIVVADCA